MGKPKYRFPVPMDFKSCREEIAGVLQEFCNRWCKREHVESNAFCLGCLLMRTIASFRRYTGYLNFINGPINLVLLLILVHVQLLSCLFF